MVATVPWLSRAKAGRCYVRDAPSRMATHGTLRMPDVVVVGSIDVDFAARMRKLPSAGETIGNGLLSRDVGGKGANQAVAAARLRARTGSSPASARTPMEIGPSLHSEARTLIRREFDGDGLTHWQRPHRGRRSGRNPDRSLSR
ncbi:PfkB family carbohydrate kinase [Leifsonia sp. 22587]|uniref:PfkB family carbohydrate kinase n=1 Tax=Leifsonia sp. 22587 TaxID=3453946 RepID=UPI003F82F943